MNSPTCAATFAGPEAPAGTSTVTDGLTSGADTTGSARMSKGWKPCLSISPLLGTPVPLGQTVATYHHLLQ